LLDALDNKLARSIPVDLAPIIFSFPSSTMGNCHKQRRNRYGCYDRQIQLRYRTPREVFFKRRVALLN
jgi:hypothetical protein